MRGRIRRALSKKLVRKRLKLSFEKSKILSKLTSPDPLRPPSRGPGWCWVRFAQTPRRSPRRSPRRRSRVRSTLRFPLTRLHRSRAFSPLARREHLLRDLSFAHDSPAPRARDWPSHHPFSTPLRATPTSLERARRDDALAKNFFRPLAPTHARERRSRLVPGASRDSPRTTDDCGRRRTRPVGGAVRPSVRPIHIAFRSAHYERTVRMRHTRDVTPPHIIAIESAVYGRVSTDRPADRSLARPGGWGADRPTDRSSRARATRVASSRAYVIDRVDSFHEKAGKRLAIHHACMRARLDISDERVIPKRRDVSVIRRNRAPSRIRERLYGGEAVVVRAWIGKSQTSDAGGGTPSRLAQQRQRRSTS